MREVAVALAARPVRVGLTASGTALGVAALVATVGITQSASQHIVSQIDELAATTVEVVPSDLGLDVRGQTSSLPWNASERLERLNGVVAAVTITEVVTSDWTARARSSDDGFRAVVTAASADLPAAVEGTLAHGRFFDAGHDSRGDAVAILGRGVADRLGIEDLGRTQSILLNETPVLVLGTLQDVARAPELLDAIIVPNGFARTQLALEVPASVIIRTELGAAALISSQAPSALDPVDPNRLVALRAPEPAAVRASIRADTVAVLVSLGLVTLLVGASGIANVTLIAVLERTSEIALRRSLGALRRHIAAQFLAESATIGALAGIVGASIGTIAVSVVCLLQGWVPVMEPIVVLVAPVAASFVGLVSGAYPSYRASQVEPALALRS